MTEVTKIYAKCHTTILPRTVWETVLDKDRRTIDDTISAIVCINTYIYSYSIAAGMIIWINISQRVTVPPHV